MRIAMLFVVLTAHAQVRPVVSQRNLDDRAKIVRLAPRFATAIRMPDAVSSVVVGDPENFLAEHSDKEPALVLVKPVVEGAAESNLLVTMTSGRQVSFVIRSEGGAAKEVDFVLTYRNAGTFLVEESALASREVPGATALMTASVPAPDPMARLLDRQRRAPLPAMLGDRVHAGVSEVLDQGQTVVVLFAVVNPQDHAIEIVPPQVQLAGKVRRGFPVRRSRWSTSEQLPVLDYRLSRRRLAPGERTDGVVIFNRPSFKQSNESVFLQIAESGAVDRPALAPIGFGVSAARKESGDDQ